jgi:hypothetical protein
VRPSRTPPDTVECIPSSTDQYNIHSNGCKMILCKGSCAKQPGLYRVVFSCDYIHPDVSCGRPGRPLTLSNASPAVLINTTSTAMSARQYGEKRVAQSSLLCMYCVMFSCRYINPEVLHRLLECLPILWNPSPAALTNATPTATSARSYSEKRVVQSSLLCTV